MPKKWPAGHRPLRPIQIQFIRRIERGDANAEQALRELKITGSVFGQWLQTPVFQKRYQRALQQVQARVASVEATAQLQHARKKIMEENAKQPESSSAPADDSPMAQRLLELHGNAATVEKKAAQLQRNQ